MGDHVLLALTVLAIDRFGRLEAKGLYHRLRDASTSEVPRDRPGDAPLSTLGQLVVEGRPWYDQATVSEDRRTLHTRLALLPVDRHQFSFLMENLLTADPREFPVIAASLKPYAHDEIDHLWSLVENPGDRSRAPSPSRLPRLPAFVPDDARHKTAAPSNHRDDPLHAERTPAQQLDRGPATDPPGSGPELTPDLRERGST